MIIDEMWYPATLNKRTRRWLRNDYTIPLRELGVLALIAVLGLLSVGYFARVVYLEQGSPIDFGVPAVLLFSLLVWAYRYEKRYPLQKYIGVPLSGARLLLLKESGFHSWTWLEVARDNECQHVIDTYAEAALPFFVDQVPHKPFLPYGCQSLPELVDRTNQYINERLREKRLNNSAPWARFSK